MCSLCVELLRTGSNSFLGSPPENVQDVLDVLALALALALAFLLLHGAGDCYLHLNPNVVSGSAGYDHILGCGEIPKAILLYVPG